MTNEQRDDMLRDMHGMLGRLSEKSEAQSDQIRDIYSRIHGNGRPGIVQELAGIKQAQQDCIERQKQSPTVTANKIAVMGIVAAVVCTPMVTTGTSLILKKLGVL